MIPNKKFIYAATPFRMQDQRDVICEFIDKKGHFPIHPLRAFPIEHYDYEKYSHHDIYRACFGMLDLCDEVWIFGIGSGSLKEYSRGKDKNMFTKSFIKRFDPIWEEYSQREKYQEERYKEIIKEVLFRSE